MTNVFERLPKSWRIALIMLYGTLVAAFVAFVVYRRQSLVEGVIDLNGFGAVARNLANGEGFSLGHGPTVRRAPVYPFFGAALLQLFGTTNASVQAELFRPLLIANCVIMGVTCLVVWRLASELFGSGVGLLAAIMCPLIPQSLRYVGMTEVETMMGLWSALLALTGFRLVQRPSIGRGAVFGVTVAVATLTKAIALLYPLVFLPLAFWHWRRARVLDRRAVVASVVAVMCFGLLLLPWSLRNMAVTNGQFKGVSSNGPGEFLRGYINAQPKYFLLRQDFGGGGPGEKWDPEANDFEEKLLRPHGIPFYRAGKYFSGGTTWTPPMPEGVSSAMLEVEKDRVESAEMKRRLLREPGGFVYKFGVQLASFWYIVETPKKSMIVGSIALIMLALAALGVRRAARSGTLVWPIVVVVLYFNLIYAAFLAFARYSMPLYPTLTILSAGGLSWLFERVYSRRSAR
jgi:4-amino-4-deoxy-L-arabinose transferase-like glycosyltransferase